MIITLEEASKRLLSGGVVAVPTETVFGLAASIYHEEAIKQIFMFKGRPSDNPLITHVSSIKQVEVLTEELPQDFINLVEVFWPGPLTLVIPIIKERLSSTICAGLPTAAFRMPSHRIALALIEKTGPLVMPSANLSGKPSSTMSSHVESDFGKEFPVLAGDDTNCSLGLESTILLYKNGRWTIGRLGAISPEQLFPILDYIPTFENEQKKPVCPGQRYRHYAPKCALHLTDTPPADCDVIIGFNDREYPKNKRVISIGSLVSPEESAHSLYSVLRLLDDESIPQAWVDTHFPHEGLWSTIRERLNKASKL